jgi:hypothetical protein
MAFFTTPKGPSGYSNLFTPDVKFDPEGKYKTSITLSEEAAKPLLEAVEEQRLELGKKAKTAKGNPFKVNEDGTYTFTFKSKKQPKVVDSKGNLIRDEIRIGGGSTIQVRGAFKEYEGFGGGVSAYLNEVRLVKLVESSADWGTDDEEDEGYVASPSSPKPSNNLEGAEAEQEEDEDVNF